MGTSLINQHARRKVEQGLQRCFHKCQATVKDVSFWIGITIAFPLEHALWEKVPPLRALAQWLGLS